MKCKARLWSKDAFVISIDNCYLLNEILPFTVLDFAGLRGGETVKARTVLFDIFLFVWHTLRLVFYDSKILCRHMLHSLQPASVPWDSTAPD